MADSPREALGKTLVELARENPNIVVLDADLASSTRMVYFAEQFPDRFFQMGIAEQNMMGAAAGMALMGKIPFISSFAVFVSRRACDQVAISIAHSGVNAKIIGAYSGLVSGNNGATHQAMEDVAIMRGIPGMVIVDPADDIEMAQVVRAIVEYRGPVYLRVTRDAWPRVSPEGYQFEMGKAVQIRGGQDVTLVGSGMMTSQCVEAAGLLIESGIRAGVLHVPTLKPIDIKAIAEAARETGAVVTAENHNIYGGLGSAVAEVLAEHAPTPMMRVGLHDCYGECGPNSDLMTKYRISPRHIAEAARAVAAKKQRLRAGATF
jgi:transketolase